MTSNKATEARQLIRELLSDPVDFECRGKGNELLKYYGNGFPLDTLRPLLFHHHVSVRGTAMFVAAELGVIARALIDEITLLVDDPDPHISWDAMESVFLCATDTLVDRFVVVVKQLGSGCHPLRRLAMRLISKAYLSQLYGAKSRCKSMGSDALVHEKCMQLLIDSESVEVHDVYEMLDSSIELVRLYGAIIARRTMVTRPDAIEYAASNTNADVRQFALESME